jgi:hypothetical protein
MTPREAVLLTRYVKACCPQQSIDEYTPDAWHDLLGDLSLDECRQAAAAVAKRQPFVAPAEIRAEVRAVREARIARLPIPAPDPDLAVNEADYRKALMRIRTELGNGTVWPKAIPAGGGDEPTQEYQEHRSDEDRDRVLAQTVDCPAEWCTALAGEPCVIKSVNQPMKVGHPERLKAAREAARGLGEVS